MSPIISKLLDKVLSYCKYNKAETLHHLLTDILPRPTLTLEAAEAINHSKLFEEMVRGLKSAFMTWKTYLMNWSTFFTKRSWTSRTTLSQKKKRKKLKITLDVEASTSNQDICIEPSLTLTGTLNVCLKDSIARIEELIVKAQGSGKTTLAQYVCKYEEYENYFDLVIWIHISQNYTVGDIFKEM
ncbi:hypothetical protein QYE76_023772 [Lolium multiflorum]|uniref:NB-ARC domain-containing protein n=1 Tax=Lolium multiflorum TaxID=4521 RepID=A0AAD8RB72_LOLMU|nr:hypothetical protein QYE76_023772 [Lolium multiflorum]